MSHYCRWGYGEWMQGCRQGWGHVNYRENRSWKPDLASDKSSGGISIDILYIFLMCIQWTLPKVTEFPMGRRRAP